MPPEVRQRLACLAASNSSLRVITFVVDTHPLLERADRVITMGGYNSVCEVLSYEKRALVVPRMYPRREQLIRAERLRDLGMLDVLHPEELSPRALTEWMAKDLSARPLARGRLDLNGLANLPSLLAELLDAPPPCGCCLRPDRRVFHVNY
jgi:predicted glycosyltransferase